MSLPLSSSTRRQMRKDLIRLRMEMHRQQLLYHSRVIRHPLSNLGGLFGSGGHRGKDDSDHHGPSPLLFSMASLLLGLFGKRLGRIGKLARFGLLATSVLKRSGR